MKKSNEEIVCSEYKRKLEELQGIIRQQNQYIQQLQAHGQISTPDIFQSSTLEKLTEENKVCSIQLLKLLMFVFLEITSCYQYVQS